MRARPLSSLCRTCQVLQHGIAQALGGNQEISFFF
jgi:hypothetical protein